jgi:hypothetical protein
MNTVSKSIEGHMMNAVPAANADRLSDQLLTDGRGQLTVAETTGGWDAYEVWNRFIKEARQRRRFDQV